MEWISVQDKLPIQKWNVTVKNGKSILNNAKYHYKKWHYWDRKLHQVTHWRYDEQNKPTIPIKEIRAYLRRAEKYRHQMQPRNFKTGPIVGLYLGKSLKSESALDLMKELQKELD